MSADHVNIRASLCKAEVGPATFHNDIDMDKLVLPTWRGPFDVVSAERSFVEFQTIYFFLCQVVRALVKEEVLVCLVERVAMLRGVEARVGIPSQLVTPVCLSPAGVANNTLGDV